MFKRVEIFTNSIKETQAFAEDFARKIKPGDIVTLTGELGAGKTTFTQGFAKGLGITNRIISPTFIIMRTYELGIRNSTFAKAAADEHELRIKKFYHIDLYRINSEKDLEGLGLREVLNEKDAVIVIEWPEKLGSMLPEKRIDIKIENIGEQQRSIRIYPSFTNKSE